MLPVPERETVTVCTMLHKLGFPVHRSGYSLLTLAITQYAQGEMQSLTKELYPFIAQHFGCSDGRAIECAIRSVIADAWATGDPQTWALYFPGLRKPPSNKLLIATLAEYLQQNTPPEAGRG